MKIKHKLLSDYSHIAKDGRIITIKAGSILENYKYQDENILFDKRIVDTNPKYFELFDWKNEFHIYMKKNKIPQPLINKLIPIVEDVLIELNKKERELEIKEKRLTELENELNEKNHKVYAVTKNKERDKE
jgi:hypothetical protein